MTTDTDAITYTSGDAPPVEVTVLLPDGSKEQRVLTVHELAQMIPVITPADLDRLTDDILEHGVNEPLVLFQGQVLDGRNRLAVATVTGTPVPVREFEGNYEEARAYVWSANAARRHLSIPQLALAAARFGFIDEAKARALLEPKVKSKPGTARPSQGWSRIASKRLGGAVSPRTLERFDQAGITQAPETMARIESGEIRRMDVAVKEAVLERTEREGYPVPVPPVVGRTAWDRLGCARGDVLAAERTILEDGAGMMTREAFAQRAREIQAVLIRIQSLYREGRA